MQRSRKQSGRSRGDQKLETTEIRMLRTRCGKTLKDKIRNERIREITAVESMAEVTTSQRLSWHDHVEGLSKAPIMAKKMLRSINLKR